MEWSRVDFLRPLPPASSFLLQDDRNRTLQSPIFLPHHRLSPVERSRLLPAGRSSFTTTQAQDILQQVQKIDNESFHSNRSPLSSLMNKGSSTSVAKTPAPLPQKSAWAKGPPQSTSAASSPRSQSPAPVAPTHSRRSSQFGNAAVGVGIASGPRGSVPPAKTANPISFGTVNGTVSDKSTPPSSSPAQAPPAAKSESRPVQSFGSIEATKSTLNGKSSLTPVSSISSTASTSSAASTTATTSAAMPLKTKVDVSAFFRGGGSSTKTSSPVTSNFSESIASPPMRSSTLSPAGPPPQSQNASGPAGPGPHGLPHAHAQPPQGYPQPPQPFVPQAMRNQNVGGGPRSPSFPRQMPNGAANRPPVANGPPGPNATGMPSPRLGPPPHQPHHHNQHQPTPVSGMQPTMQPVPWTAGYYYHQYQYMPPNMAGMPGAEQYMQYPPQPWQMHQQQQQPGPHPQTPQAHPHGLPVSPRQPPPPLQPPGTPPTGIAAQLPSAGPRLNTNASAFVPGQVPPAQALQQRQSKVKITDASGHEVDFNGLRRQTPSVPSTPAAEKNRRATVRLETEEARLKRIAEEKTKRDQEERLQKAKEEEERKKREAKAEEERKKKDEEERVKKAEEDKKRREEEEKEKVRKEEEERERVRVEAELERKRKEEEEERARKEEEEKERLRKEENERLLKEVEERQRKEEEEKERARKEEEELKAKAKEEEKPKVSLEIKPKKENELSPSTTDVPFSVSPESHKKRPIPGPLDLSSTHRPGLPQPLPSALATARHIQDLDQVQYPEGVKSPKPELNTNAKDGKFRYDRDFLMQFMSVCKEKPDNLPSLEAIGLEPSDQAHSMGRGGSGRRGVSGGMGPPSSTAARQASVGLGIGSLNGFGKSASGFATMGNFSAPGKLSSEERFMRSTSMGGPPGGPPFTGGRSSPMVRSSSQGGPSAIGAGPLGSKRTRSKRGEARNDANRISAAQAQFSAAHAANAMALEPVAPLEATANRWVPVSASRKPVAVDMDAPEVVDRKVRSLLNKLTMEKFESISNQIIQWANKSESEKDGHTLIQVIRLAFEQATNEARWSEMYARLCRKMMEQISPDVQDDGIRNSEGKPITGGLLFRKYLLNRCQEDFERGWKQKESTAAAAAEKANEDQALKVESEKEENKESGETPQFSEEYYAAQKAKRQGLGLVKFIGELFKLQMLTERIMHECIKKLLSNVNNPEEEEIESLCMLLSTVGQSLDTSKARGHMDVYFSRMKDLAKSSNVSSPMRFMLLNTIVLRERKWNTRIAVAAPMTIAQIHEAAAKEKIQQGRISLARSAGMSRGGLRRGYDCDNSWLIGPDGWAGAPGPSRPANEAGYLPGFGKIAKSGGPMTFSSTPQPGDKESEKKFG